MRRITVFWARGSGEALLDRELTGVGVSGIVSFDHGLTLLSKVRINVAVSAGSQPAVLVAHAALRPVKSFATVALLARINDVVSTGCRDGGSRFWPLRGTARIAVGFPVAVDRGQSRPDPHQGKQEESADATGDEESMRAMVATMCDVHISLYYSKFSTVMH